MVGGRLAAELAANNYIRMNAEIRSKVPGTVIETFHGFKLARNPRHSDADAVAFSLNLDERSAKELARMASNNARFSVLLSPADRPHYVETLLKREGLGEANQLNLMWLSQHRLNPDADVFLRGRQPVEVPERDRLLVARFTLEQFNLNNSRFPSQQMAAANANAQGVRWFCVKESEQIIAAFSVFEDGDCSGIYNFCVLRALRARGIGRAMLQWAIRHLSDRPLVLACENHLLGWYEQSGFTANGKIRHLYHQRYL
jgi:GNAT superfamily N-acetyltransferase